jgi:hypothetical protein
MSLEDFAFWSENAYWLHEQQLMIRQANALGAMTGGAKQ